MKHRDKLILIISIFIIIVSCYLVWIFAFSPHLDTNKISKITQYRMPSPPEIISVYDEDTIKQYVEFFNTIDFTPVVKIRVPRGGWYARCVIEFESGSSYEMSFEDIYNGCMLLRIDHRYYKISLISYSELLNIISSSKPHSR